MECLLNKCRYLNHGGCPDSFYTIKKKVIEACEEIFKVDKDNEVALGYKVYALRFIDSPEEVLECCDHAIGLYPDNFRFYYIKAHVLFYELDDFEGAVENFEKMIETDVNEDYGPEFFIDVLKLKKSELVCCGNYADAIDCCEMIMRYPEYNEDRLNALFTIESIVDKHHIEYEPSDNYRQTLEANREVYDWFSCAIGEYDAGYVEGCRQFRDYDSFIGYLRDCLICMIEMCPDGDEKSIRQKMKLELGDIKWEFYLETPAYDTAARYVNRYKHVKELLNRRHNQ